ncbi:MAG: hypothetical protein KC609_20310 [Myxococcales bacterium]|nr:hypothetical protein [Myxococcales bacterium]
MTRGWTASATALALFTLLSLPLAIGAAPIVVPISTTPTSRRSTNKLTRRPKTTPKKWRGPTIEEVQRAALQTSSLHVGRSKSWLLRARLAPLLPSRFQVRYGDDFSDDVRITDNGDGYTNKLGSDRQRKLQFMAEWDLSRLVYQPEELKISDRHLARQKRRIDLLVRVTRLFFDRRRLQVRLGTPLTGEERALARIKLQELTALLDALTARRFHGRWD